MAEGLHPGAQLHVTLGGKTVIDFACGEAQSGVPMTTQSVVQWYSAGKPLTAVAFAQLMERGVVTLHAPVSVVIPEFGQNGKEQITFFHLLTHTAGFRMADAIPPATLWPQMIQKICTAPQEPGWIPGKRAGYSTAASWYILAESIQRLTKISFDDCLKSEFLNPLGMRDTWLRLPEREYNRYDGRLAFMYNTARGQKAPLPMQDAEGMDICRPGASARGPIRELTRFYNMLLSGGILEGHTYLKSVSDLTTRHRIGMYDETFQHTIDYGLGFILNSNRYGPTTVPYGYGIHASDETFGHSGAQSSCAFADAKHELVVAWVVTGHPGERSHQTRQRNINSAIYDYLGLATK